MSTHELKNIVGGQPERRWPRQKCDRPASRVRGDRVTSKLTFIKDTYGEPVLTSVMEAIDSGDRLTLENVRPSGWCGLELYDRLLTTICKIAANGDKSIYKELGRHSCEYTFSTNYAAFRPSDPMDMLTKLGSVYYLRNYPAEIYVTSETDGRCTIRILQPRATAAICKVTRAFYERTAQLCGGRNVQMHEPSCAAEGDLYCQYELVWQPSRS